MSLFKSKEKTEEERYETISKLRTEGEELDVRMEIAEKKAVISQLEKQYGHNWRTVLGVSRLTDISTLKSFLTGSKRSLEQIGGTTTGSSGRLSPLPPAGMRDGHRRS